MTPAEIAAQEFATRRAAASRRVAEGRWSADEADARLRPWLHLAAMAGAQLDAVYEDGITLFPFDRAGQPVRLPMSLFLDADDRHAACIALLEAVDAAIAASEGEPEKLPQARRLIQLAGHFNTARLRPIGPRAQAAA